VHEFVQRARPRATVGRGRTSPYGGPAFGPLAEVVLDVIGLTPSDPADVVRERIAKVVGDHPRRDVLANLVASAIGAASIPAVGDDMTWAVRTFLEVLARERPLVLIIDDIQWADSALLRLLHSVASSANAAPVLLLCVARPELLDEHPTWGGGLRSASSLPLHALSDEEIDELVRNLLGGNVPVDISSWVAAAADGNPLYVEEFLSVLLEDGALLQANGRWVATKAIDSAATPPSIVAVLAARLDQVPANELDALEPAAVVGQTFSWESLVGLRPETPAADLETALDGLMRRELVRLDRATLGANRRYRFKHLLIRDAAYARLTKRRRIDLHERLADVLAADPSEGPDETVAAHLEQAYRYRVELDPRDPAAEHVARRAAAGLARAAKTAQARGTTETSAALLERAAALLPVADSERIRLLPDLIAARLWAGDFDRAIELNQQLLDLPDTPEFERLRWRGIVLRSMYQYTLMRITPQELADDAQEAVARFERWNDDNALGRAWFLLGSGQIAQGHWSLGHESFSEAAVCWTRAGNAQDLGMAHVHLTACLFEGSARVEESLISATDLVNWARAAGQRGTEAIGLAYVARLFAMSGRFDAARSLVAEAMAINADLGRKYYIAADHAKWVSTIEWLAGTPQAAEPAIRRGIDLLMQLGENHASPRLYTDLSRLLVHRGRIDEAEAWLPVRLEPRMRDWSFAAWQSVRALILAYRGDLVAAVALAQNAATQALEMDSPIQTGQALEDLAEVLELAGRSSDAIDALRRAIDQYEAKGATAPARRLERVLALAATAT
jgi:tetratricopeptide (TPR) repeat protein